MTAKKIQFFMSDLAYKLDIGQIREIHVAEQNGQKVLRIECEKKEESEYKTVKASKTVKPEKSGKPARTVRNISGKRNSAKSSTEPTLPQKMAAAAKDFLLNPERNKGKKFDGNFGGGMSFGDDGRFNAEYGAGRRFG